MNGKKSSIGAIGIIGRKRRCFYNAFAEFDNQDIESSLKSENLIVRILAVLDRRVGKRRLVSMKETIAEEPDTFL